MNNKVDTKQQLLRGNFTPTPQNAVISDPLEPTPMVLTLDQLRPYDMNPRRKRNPKYEEIKASILARGLDDTPTVSRRPGEPHYIIDNGGNTRLEILNDLWKETRDETFFKVHCLFRPWKGDIKALTGHMSENDNRGSLLWIERCLGVAQLRQLYESEKDQRLNQSELARRLKADGYAVDRADINRMDQTLQYLFPCIPNILWGGMGRDSVRNLLNLRSHSESAWKKLINDKGAPLSGLAFDQILANSLQHFDEEPESYVFQHVQDELIGRLTEELRPNGVSYELILMEIEASRDPSAAAKIQQIATEPEEESSPPVQFNQLEQPSPAQPQNTQPTSTEVHHELQTAKPTLPSREPATTEAQSRPEVTEAPVNTPASPGIGEKVESIPVSVGGLARVSDVWTVYPQYQNPQALRHHIDGIAYEISTWANIIDFQTSTQQQEGIGFRLTRPDAFEDEKAEAVWHVLAALTREHQEVIRSEIFELALIQILPDELLIKLFRLIRLTRYLREMLEE